MTAQEIVAELKELGTEQTRKTFLRHGAPESMFGVKVGDLKAIQKRVKHDHALALELYDTGISDAMYLAGLIAEPHKITKAHLRKWAKAASWHMIAEYPVAWVAAESRFATELAVEWIDSPKELVASAGWATYSSYVSITPDADLDLAEIDKLLTRVQTEVHSAPNRVRYTMNGFVIAVGGCVVPRAAKAKMVARAVGAVTVDMGDTSCQVPAALAYIEKVEAAGKLGHKRKSAVC